MAEIKFFNLLNDYSSYPYEVIEKRTDKKYIVREMSFKLDDNGHQVAPPASDPDGELTAARMHKDGKFYLPGYRTPLTPTDTPTAFWELPF